MQNAFDATYTSQHFVDRALAVLHADLVVLIPLGEHPKPAMHDHLKTGQ